MSDPTPTRHDSRDAYGRADALETGRWRTEPSPSRLLAWANGGVPPNPREVAEAAHGVGLEIESVGMLEAAPPVAWAMVAHEVGAPAWLLWCEPSSDGDVPASAAESSWILGIETLISASGPDDASSSLARHRAMKRWLHTAGADSALLDPVTGRWLDSAEWTLDRALDPLASLDELWCVRVHRRPGASMVWLSTAGLSRCGRPDLELLEIPEPLAAAGAAMLDALAALLLEEPPHPETPWRIGPASDVSLERLDEVLATLGPAAPGSLEDRRRLEPDLQIDERIAVVCAAERRGSLRRIPVPPLELLERVARGEVGLFRSRHEAARLRRLVAAHAPLLSRVAQAIESGCAGLRALVSTASSTAVDREWAALVGVAADGWLVQPVDLAGRAIISAPASIADFDSMSDWRVDLGDRTFGPDDATALEAELVKLEPGIGTEGMR
jgi:hypothetical protein